MIQTDEIQIAEEAKILIAILTITSKLYIIKNH
ncbi:MAG: hypothetical protein US57_C0006G0087 [Candidatus Moranbacteria bacterium GW2011_GWC2_37_73]|nr:MAG: hypothetical protein UR95_C0007G0090 [Parcubacteria group bacterium GW2011_GWC1_36_108]KKQ00121.1 MAG: hypothetical protein US09_C0020G0003 [Candidatus Moranbacteria bacterium GW2011_GWD1_36_198]KKQ01292.1 MAG: hypothetical protein US10_C0019G0003 [Candidatus Moranbacteria bacterium GW2011_GWD2_36_198]KKQ40015.1 MAG: hypothetical protein US57_C0006G0087 [Candidatus Moranbacteria bacterium GW2011_GWC2_37_73]